MIQNAPEVGFDTEISGPNLVNDTFPNLYKSTLAGFSLALPDGQKFYIPVGHKSKSSKQTLGNLPTAEALRILSALRGVRRVWAHNWKFDLQAMRAWHYNATRYNLYDSLVLAWMLGNTSGTRSTYGLKALAKTYLGMEMQSFESVSNGKPFGMLTPTEAAEYAGDDALATLMLGQKMYPELKGRMVDAFEHQEMAVVPILADMEWRGVGLDVDSIYAVWEDYAPRAKELAEAWVKEYGCSISSPKQLQKLYEEKTWSTQGIKKTAHGYAVDSLALDRHLHSKNERGRRAAEIKKEYQFLSKNLGTYTLNLIDWAYQYPDKRLHPSFNQTGTATGRLSSNNPNAQNLPARTDLGKRILGCFVPADGKQLVSADYSQIELRVLAYFTQGGLHAAYKEGRDVHQQTAELVGCTRSQGKTINFASIYGASGPRLAQLLDVSPSEGTKFLNKYWEAYEDVADFRETVVSKLKAKKSVPMLSGRRRWFKDFDANAKGVDLQRATRQAFNAVIQGSAADIVKQGMIRAHKAGLHIVAQIHDDIIIETDNPEEDAKVLQECLEGSWKSFDIPLIAEPSVGMSWGELK